LPAKEEKLGRFASKSEEREPSPGDPASGCSEGVSPWDSGDPTVEASAPEDIFFFFNNDEAMIPASHLQNLMNTIEQSQNLIERTFAKPHLEQRTPHLKRNLNGNNRVEREAEFWILSEGASFLEAGIIKATFQFILIFACRIGDPDQSRMKSRKDQAIRSLVSHES
jgi:hypothetical protein